MTYSINIGDMISASTYGSLIVNAEANNGVVCTLTKSPRIDLNLSQTKQLIAFLQQVVKDQTPAPAQERPASSLKPQGFMALSDQSRVVLQHMRRAGSLSAREAMDDYGITSATLARRVCDLEEAGFYVNRTRKVHPITHRRYTRYALAA